MKTLKYFLAATFLSLTFQNCENQKETANQKKKFNVLFIIVDDLRPELGCYGNKAVHSPHIDQIAKEGVVFKRAYAQYPVCGPSRCSILSGLRPTKTRFTSNRSLVDEEVPQCLTLPGLFKQNGYYTISNGKIFHDHGNVIDGMDGWSEIPWEPHPGFFVWEKPENKQYSIKGYKYFRETDKYKNNPGPSYEAANVKDVAYPTGKVTQKAIYDLRRLKEVEEDKPFFMAVGYRKPHLPHNSPQKYWDIYDPQQFKLADNFETSKSIPAIAVHNFGELRSYRDIPSKGELEKSKWLKLIHGYYANVSFTDAHIGLLMDELERLGLKEETIVVVVGDHGYQLTDHGMWSKHNTFHASLHSPLIFYLPGNDVTQNVGSVVELVDIYPTLADLCGLELPDHLAGKSLSPYIKQDISPDTNTNNDLAFSRVGNAETVVTQKYIYTEWINGQGEIYEKMLFNLEEDPLETGNLAVSHEYQDTVKRLSHILNEHLVSNGNNY